MNSGDSGIVAIGTDISLELNNTAIGQSAQSGIVMSEGVDAQITRAEVTRNGGHGIEMHQGTQVTWFEANTIGENQGAGVLVSGAIFTPEGGNNFFENKAGAVLRQ